MRVYLRLQADAQSGTTLPKKTFVPGLQLLAPDGYERNKRNAEHTIKKLQFLVGLIEDAQKREKEQQ